MGACVRAGGYKFPLRPRVIQEREEMINQSGRVEWEMVVLDAEVPRFRASAKKGGANNRDEAEICAIE